MVTFTAAGRTFLSRLRIQSCKAHPSRLHKRSAVLHSHRLRYWWRIVVYGAFGLYALRKPMSATGRKRTNLIDDLEDQIASSTRCGEIRSRVWQLENTRIPYRTRSPT